MRKLLIKLLAYLLEKELPLWNEMQRTTRVNLMSKLYQNPAMQLYVKEREEYLIHSGMRKFIKGDTGGAKELAGQLVELKTLHLHMRTCYTSKIKERESVKRDSKLRPKRRHSQ